MGTLTKFWYVDENENRIPEKPDIHIEGLNGFAALCGGVDEGFFFEGTDEKPTCSACMEVFNYIKKGRL